MDIAQLWPSLSAQTRDWLIANNGDALSSEVLDELVRAHGSAIPDAWWGNQGDQSNQGNPSNPSNPSNPTDRYLPDDAIDWIEATANEEEAADQALTNPSASSRATVSSSNCTPPAATFSTS